MSFKNVFYFSGLLACLGVPAAVAGFASVTPTITTSGASTVGVDNGYAGLKWTLDGGFAPAIVVGYRHAEVTTGGNAQGADVSFSFNIFNGFEPGKLRVKYFNGQENIQGEVGAGYDFSKGLFAGIGAQGPFSNLGVDYNFTDSNHWEPYFIINTLGEYDKPSRNTIISCPANSTYNNATGLCVFNPA